MLRLQEAPDRTADLRSRIAVERKCHDGACAMLPQLRDDNARQQCLQTIAESRRRLEFLHAELIKLLPPDPPLMHEIPTLQPPPTVVSPPSAPSSYAPSTLSASLTAPDQPGSHLAPLPRSATVNSFNPGARNSSGAVFGSLLSSLGFRRSTYDFNAASASTHASNSSVTAAAGSTAHLSASGLTNSISFPGHAGGGGGDGGFSTIAANSTLRGLGSMASIAEIGPISTTATHSSRTNFGFIRSDTTLTPEKVKFRLLESRSRLDIEQKVREGTERMLQATGATITPSLSSNAINAHLAGGTEHSGSSNALSYSEGASLNKRRLEVEAKLTETTAKISILAKAVQRHQGIYLHDEKLADTSGHLDEASGGSSSGLARTNSVTLGSITSLSSRRRTYTGKIVIRPLLALGLPGKKSSKAEVYVVLTVDGNQRAKSRSTRSKWTDELIANIDKAHDVEISLHEKNGTILAIQWFKIGDLCEELALNDTSGTVTGQPDGNTKPAQALREGSSNSTTGDIQSSQQQHQPPPPTDLGLSSLSRTSTLPRLQDGVEVWLDLEPTGQILVRINFIPEKTPKKSLGVNTGVQRRKNVQKFFMRQGHKFSPFRSYQVLKCASCSEFVFSGKAYQCQACSYTCHRRCQDNVASKCITRSTTDMAAVAGSASGNISAIDSSKNASTLDSDASGDAQDSDNKVASMIKHRIPHRFELTGGIVVNWCCHCGTMLPIGKKQYFKCTECANACHKGCMPLVPHFCGLPPEMMSQLRSLEINHDRLKKGRDASTLAATQQQQQQVQQQERIPQTHQPSKSKSATDLAAVSALTSLQDVRKLDQIGKTDSFVLSQQTIASETSANASKQDLVEAATTISSLSIPVATVVATSVDGGVGVVHESPSMRVEPLLQQMQPNVHERVGVPQSVSHLMQQQQQAQTAVPDAQRGMSTPPRQQQPQQQQKQQQLQQHTQPSVPHTQRGVSTPPRQQRQQQQEVVGTHVQLDKILQMTPDRTQATGAVSHSQVVPIPFGSNADSSDSASGSSSARKVAHSKPRVDSMPPFKSGPKGVGLDDFNFLAVVGKGNFGKVMLAEEKHTRCHYAIKVLKKEFIIENDEVESTKAEKRVFMAANRARHPFLVNLHSCFQTESRIYFVMEFIAGGDLMWHIQQQQFSEKRAKFYACEVLLALEYFHQNNIVYRDLKLDNILLTPAGHIKIADYGLCKEDMVYGSTTTTFCGTPEFMAPEILSERPYTRAVDWWALGVLIYEMLLGQSPFKGDDEEEIFEAILHQEILYPPTLARDAVNLLQRLLTKDPAKRLGGGRADALEIKQHPFFAGVDWDSVLRLELPPPFTPDIRSPTDISNFDEEFTHEMPVLTPCTSVLSVANQEEFRGFTHLSDWAQEIRARIVA